MRIVVHDLSSDDTLPGVFLDGDSYVIPAAGPKAPCLGCYACWIRTPGKCIIRDRIKDMGARLGACSELVIITETLYGGFAPETKNIIDRSISYLLPFFKNIDGELHHRMRYKDRFSLTVYIYKASDINNQEREQLEKYIKAVSINLGANNLIINFIESVGEVAQYENTID